MRTRFGLILKILVQRNLIPSIYINPNRTTCSLRVAFRRGLSLQESAEIIQLIKHPPTLFNLSHFFKGYDPRFSKDPTPDVPTPDVPTKSPGAPLPMV